MLSYTKLNYFLIILIINLNLFCEINITKSLIPSAGLGTRLLPLSKSMPKELIPLLDKPAIQYIIEEGLNSGINEFGIILNPEKAAIKNYFSHNLILENNLKKANKLNLLSGINNIIDSSRFGYISQTEALGTGHAVLMGESYIGDNYFGVFFPDDIVIGEICLKELIKISKKYNASVIAVKETPLETISSYGVIAIKSNPEENVFELAGVVEKPAPKDAPSNLSIIGRYVLSPKIFESIKKVPKAPNGEHQLTDAILDMMQSGEKVMAYKISGERLDVGNIPSWLESNIKMALQNPTYKDITLNTIK